ncbi:MAG: thioredoxin-like domain-containing protein [Dysgonomonas sp.]
MKTNIHLPFILFICLTTAFVSCKKQPQFTITGIVENAGGDTLYLEKRGFENIAVVDSTIIDEKGNFSIKGERPQTPDLYLLRLGNQSINLSVDSTETISIKTTKKEFSANYTVEGSSGSEMMKDVVLLKSRLENNIKDLNNQKYTDDEYLEKVQTYLSTYKDSVKRIMIKDLKSPAAYFALFQKINDVLIFDPYDKNDSKMYSAVATSWDFYYKDSPRAKHLREFTLNSIKQRSSAQQTGQIIEQALQANESEYYNIKLPDRNNKTVALSSLKGKVVLLNFTVYQTEYSPAYNIILNNVYNKFKNDMEIYQVSFDSNLHFWQNAAANLPWITVRDNNSVRSNLIYKFNIQEFPTTFIVNRQGELIKRLSLEDDIAEEVRKAL